MFRSYAVRNTAVTLVMAFAASLGCNAANRSPIPAPATDSALAQTPESRRRCLPAVLWGTQSVFERVKGVLDTTAGYSGGSAATATYEQVGQENTGHAEVGEGRLRPIENNLWPAAADFLFRRSRSDSAKPAGSGRG